MAEPPLPPGQTGLPLLGETLAFVADGYRFIDERLSRHGHVFRTRLLGRRTVVFAGLEANDAWTDPDLIQRAGSMPWHVQRLFGGRSLPLLDGADHRTRKSQVLAGLTPEAVASYIPAMQSHIEEALDAWAENGVLPLVEELKALALALIFGDLCSLERGPELDALQRDYTLASEGFAALPINLPGTTFSKALRARDRILALLRRLVAEHRARPSGDGLSRILAAEGPDGRQIGDEEAALELLHIGVAGFVIFALLAELVIRIAARPDIRSRLTAEARAVTRPLTPKSLAQMPYTLQTVLEAKRTTRILPAIFGKARRTFTFRGHSVPQGWMVLWAVRASHMDPAIYPDPERFDPDRFGPPRNEQLQAPNAFAPQGPGQPLGHRCAGVDYSTVAASLFTALLVRDYTVELPAQDLTVDFSRTPPLPRSGLRVRVMRKLILAGATAAA